MLAQSLIERATKWASLRDDIRALALVGSHARGQAQPGSDIDLVVVCSEPARYLENTGWVSDFGDVARLALEDWGRVQSVRVVYRQGSEVEFGIAGLDPIALFSLRSRSDMFRGASSQGARRVPCDAYFID